MFQASKKTSTTSSVGTDFKDLKLVKQAETAAIKRIEKAQNKVEALIANAERELIEYEEKSLASLKAKLNRKFEVEEIKAKKGANNIRAEGENEAEQLKQEVQERMPKAVEHIVKTVISS